MTALAWLAVLAAALFGAPLFVVVLAAAIVGFHTSGIDLSIVAVELYRISDTPMLIALPLFTYAGYVLAAARTSARLVDVFQSLAGWMPSGLAVVGFLVCAFFTALTGASGVTIVALGALLLPALQQAGYGERFSLGLVTTSGSLGLLLVPSVPLILYGIVAQQIDVGQPFEIEDLFVAGLVPAALMVVMLSAWAMWTHRGGVVPRVPLDARRVGAALWAARFELPLPVIILGGIYGGFFAISEAAAITALYVTIVEVALYREVRLAELARITRNSMTIVAGIIMILGAALAFSNYLVDSEVPQRLFEFVKARIESPITFLLLLNLLLLVLGALLDVFSALVIMVPLILPVAAGYGIDPVHLGIIFLANMQIGYFTPPIGMNLFIASYRFGKPLTELFAACWPFLWVLLAALAVITYVPAVSLGLGQLLAD
jgi:tripartite ATP-independent transporter DctM subunit